MEQDRTHLDTGNYPTGIKISDREMKDLETQGTLARDPWHGDWNYTLHPTPTRPNRADLS